jgi:protein-S-isoprenylcysteine O-methyltransferase Ste14
MHRLELKIPPALVMLLAMLMTYGCSRYMPNAPLPFFLTGLYWYVTFVGAMIILSGIWQFRKAHTTVDPTSPEKASQLVSSGIYRFTRNPMYLGMLVIVAASVIKFGNAYGLIALPLFVVYMNYFQIEPEERIIEGIFADEYVQYKNKVRRWI